MKRSFITNSKLKLTSRTLPENLDQQKMFALPESYFPPPNSVEFRRSIIHVLKCVLTAPKIVRRGSRVAEKQTRSWRLAGHLKGTFINHTAGIVQSSLL